MKYPLKQSEVRLFNRNPLLFGFAITVMALMLSLQAPAQEAGTGSDAVLTGLVSVDSKFDELYVKPDVDFSRYKNVLIEDIPVSFMPYWYREHRETLTDRDVERIKTQTAKSLRKELSEELTEGNAYAIVEEVKDNTLRIKPEIIKMNVTAPDTSYPGIRRSYVYSAGHATLSLEVYDAQTGELLAKVKDHRRADGFGEHHLQIATRATNTHEFRQIMSVWSNRLREEVLNRGRNTAS